MQIATLVTPKSGQDTRHSVKGVGQLFVFVVKLLFFVLLGLKREAAAAVQNNVKTHSMRTN